VHMHYAVPESLPKGKYHLCVFSFRRSARKLHGVFVVHPGLVLRCSNVSKRADINKKRRKSKIVFPSEIRGSRNRKQPAKVVKTKM
jgi:hypothetical protein